MLGFSLEKGGTGKDESVRGKIVKCVMDDELASGGESAADRGEFLMVSGRSQHSRKRVHDIRDLLDVVACSGSHVACVWFG